MNKIFTTSFFILFFLNIAFTQNEESHLDSLDHIVAGTMTKVGQDKENKYSGIFNSWFTEDPFISAKKVEASNPADATRIMQSKIAGLAISANSYSPGASSRILLRGFRSFSGDNQPVILLNGMPINNSEWNNNTGHTDQSNRLLDIDPNFIKSIKVTKSMAGRAKYGIIGGNGVLEIQTKEGFTSKPRVTLTSSIGIDQISNKLALQNTYGQGRTVNGEPIYRGPEDRENFAWGPLITDLFYDSDPNYLYDRNGMLSYIPGGTGSGANIYDPYDFFENSLNTNISLNVSGGSQSVNYFITASSNRQQGVIPTTDYNRYNLSSTLNFAVTPKFSVQLNALLSKSNAQRNMKGSNLQGIMFGLLRTPATFDNANGLENSLNDPLAYQFANGDQRSANAGLYDNPYWSLNKNKHDDEVNRRIIKLSGQYDLSEQLALLFNIGSDNYSDARIGGKDINPNNSFGLAYERNVAYNAQNLDVSLRYDIKKGENLHIASTIGFNYNQDETAYQITEGTRLRSADNVSVGNLEEVTSTESINQVKRSGGLLSLDVGYKNFLNITGSLKQDYSNKFGAETNGFLSYGLGGGLSITNLLSERSDAIVDPPVNVQLLASIGKFGNEPRNAGGFSRYANAIIGGDGFISSSSVNGFELNNFGGSENLTAETINAFDIGLDFSFLKVGGLRFKITYYNESSKGLILTDRLASSTGIQFFESNAGAISNKGFDVSFSMEPIRKKKVNWGLTVDFNKNKNNVKNIGEFNTDIILGGFVNTSSSLVVDHPYGVIVGSGFLRNEDGLLVIGGDGFPVRDPERKVVADPNPDWTMYIGNTLRLGKSLTFNAVIDIKKGGDLYCGTCGTLDYQGKSQISADDRSTSTIFEGVTEAGSVNNQSVELASANGTYTDYYRVRYGFGGLTEMSIYDASWVRLRNVSLKYDFSKLIKTKFIKNMYISFFAENLIIITEYPGIDPETNLTGNSGAIGIDYYNNPGTRRYGVSFQVSF